MELHGKAKEDFESFLKHKFHTKTEDFYDLFFSMQFGVYVDFFDSKALSIGLYKTDVNKWFGMILRDERYLNNFKPSYYNIAEARKAAIEKACELYNAQCS